MRRRLFAVPLGTLLAVMTGCSAEFPPSAAGSRGNEPPAPSSPEADPPAPPPPPAPPSPPPSPEQLAREALQSPDPDRQEVAAVRLAQLGEPATEHLRRVLSESQSPAVRAACIQGLAVLWDYESMPAMLDALEDESEVVRGRADLAVERLMSVDYGYRCDDPPEIRAEAVTRLREQWEQFRDSETLKDWKRRLEERQRREEQQLKDS